LEAETKLTLIILLESWIYRKAWIYIKAFK